jgi:hypothetical protein
MLDFWPPTRIWRRQPRFARKSSLKFSRPAAARPGICAANQDLLESRVRKFSGLRPPTSVLRSRRVVDSERRVAKSRLPAANQVLRSRRVVDSKGRVRQNLGSRRQPRIFTQVEWLTRKAELQKSRPPAANQVLRSRRVVDYEGRVATKSRLPAVNLGYLRSQVECYPRKARVAANISIRPRAGNPAKFQPTQTSNANPGRKQPPPLDTAKKVTSTSTSMCDATPTRSRRELFSNFFFRPSLAF